MFTINLKKIKPAPLRGFFDGSAIWGESLTFDQGKRYHIYAASGKGKSTFMHIIYGLRQDYEGELLLDGRPAKLISASDWATLRMANLSIVFQDLRLFLQCTALENIQIKNNLTNHKTEGAIKEMADRLGIVDLLDNPCEQLSYGQRQRVAILRAVCQPFDFLLLDEPFSHLDMENVNLASELLGSVCQSNGAGLLITSLEKSDSNFEYDDSVLL